MGIASSREEWFAQAEKRFEDLGVWEKVTYGERLREWAVTYKDRIALIEDNVRLTYQELDQKADELAFGFYHMGIKKGDNVAVQLPNTISFFITCFALFRIGAVPVLILPAQRESDVSGILEVAKPVAYIIPTTYLGFNYEELAARLVQKHSCIKQVITDGASEAYINLNDLNGCFVELAGPAYRDIAVLILSGGTTGVPKLIPRTHTDYIYNAKASAKRSGMSEKTVYLAVLPVAHNFALCSPGVFGTFSVGGKVVLSKTTSCDEVFPLIEQEKVTITSLVPALLKVWEEVLEWDDVSDLSSLQVLQVGGTSCNVDVLKNVSAKIGCKIQQVLGIAEGLLCYTGLDDPEEIIYSCQGKSVAEAEDIKIVDENGNEVPQGEFGELIFRGPLTIRGYYRLPEQNTIAFNSEGYYCSGDRVRITAEGNLHIDGRIKEQINRAGEKIMPAEIEYYLCKHPEVKDAALVPLPDETLGHRSCAYLITDNKTISLQEIHAFLKERGLARYKMPDQLEFTDSWPLSSVGKLDKNKLIKMAIGE
ncbi:MULTISPECIES: (2,3-dihydroxybenzoyl)adenylate synthase [Sporomusa]|uniref:(2,3-dihydroxybenzoyl)adenylate synthase n=1 Tax=Sporomusa TaxID=2375 RepID=UPI00202DE06A|nr:AMP-binding protein [Sporomusa sphaeroides]MCM0760874.1 AMP-binding protein [Sporomusa sphaeroides DSM 2875]HML33607.1 AMP-binding protein [Sporomusa sphaeroides]